MHLKVEGKPRFNVRKGEVQFISIYQSTIGSLVFVEDLSSH